MYIAGLVAILAVVLGLLVRRGLDRRAENTAWQWLSQTGTPSPVRFDPRMVSDLPEPARRFFLFVFEPGARLHRVISLEMGGELALGTGKDAKFRPMQAQQILAPPFGLVWRLRTGAISGSDVALPETSWTRFWLFHLIPVARVGGFRDHHLSAFGRVIAEAAFWAPASLLPSQNVCWRQVDENTARATVTFQDFSQSVELSVGPDGCPRAVVLQRWSNENPDRRYQWQPFGGTLSAFRVFDGVRLPTRVEGGNHFGTDAYFPFYKAIITKVTMID